MPKSLADLRSEKRKKPNERPYELCLAPDLVAEVEVLNNELERLPFTAFPSEEGERTGPPERMGGGGPQAQRAKEIHARLLEVLDEMAEYEGELRVHKARTDGEWRQWCNEHPAREEDEPGYQRDVEVAGLRAPDGRVLAVYCNADDLMDDLATYAHTWNGEPLEDGDWDGWVERQQVPGPDQKAIARLVVGMYEREMSLPKWRSVLSANLRIGNESSSPAPSESPSGDSSDGSPESSTEATTETETG